PSMSVVANTFAADRCHSGVSRTGVGDRRRAVRVLYSPATTRTHRHDAGLLHPHRSSFTLMLPEQLKTTIQSAYRQILENKGLTPRYGQRLMIAEIARSFGEIAAQDESSADAAAEETPPGGDSATSESSAGEGPICVIEAGTGTGKTLAYVLGTVPVAR